MYVGICMQKRKMYLGICREKGETINSIYPQWCGPNVGREGGVGGSLLGVNTGCNSIKEKIFKKWK